MLLNKGRITLLDTTKIYHSNNFLWILMGFGIILRLFQYLSNRSLWLDEAKLALSIVNKPFNGLLQPLDYGQCAPVVFLFIEKFFVELFGNSEYSLRLFPLLSGIIIIFLFLSVARKVLSDQAVPLAVILLISSESLIYYSSEVKQYSVDTAITLLLFAMTFIVNSNKLSFFRLFAFGLLGAISIWLSFPAVFVLAGIGVSLICANLYQKKWKKIIFLFPVFLLWLASLTVLYIFLLSNIPIREGLQEYWKHAFMPFPPITFSEVLWFPDTLGSFVKNPGGFRKNTMLVFLVFAVGLYYMFKNKKLKVCILILPIVFALLASGLHLYPFRERLILYLVPVFLLGVAEGTRLIFKRLWSSAPAIGICFVSLILYCPALTVANVLIDPIKHEEIKPVLSYLNSRIQPEDVLYIYHGAVRPCRYYADRYKLDQIRYIEGVNLRGGLNQIISEVDKFVGKERTWFLFSHTVTRSGLNVETLFQNYLDTKGTQTDAFKTVGSSLYLYDLKSNMLP